MIHMLQCALPAAVNEIILKLANANRLVGETGLSVREISLADQRRRKRRFVNVGPSNY